MNICGMNTWTQNCSDSFADINAMSCSLEYMQLYCKVTFKRVRKGGRTNVYNFRDRQLDNFVHFSKVGIYGKNLWA